MGLPGRCPIIMVLLSTMTSVCPDHTLDELIAVMKTYGYKGLEARVEWKHASGIEATLTKSEREAIKEKMAANGLEISCIATGVQMANPDPEAREEHIDKLRMYVDLAADLGCKYVRTFGGPQAGYLSFLDLALVVPLELA